LKFTVKKKTIPPIPNTLVPARKGDFLMVIVPHYWGKGEDINKAKEALKQQCGSFTGKPWRVCSVDPKTYIGDMGGLVYPNKDHPPLTIAESEPRQDD
jgi:hypothetical protein